MDGPVVGGRAMGGPAIGGGRRSEAERAVIIGSGFGGLALAIRLRAAGLDVTIVEKREHIGGRADRLEDSGYVFDMGPSLITAPEIIDSVFRAGGRRLTDYVDLVRLNPFYRIHFHDKTWIDYVGDVEGMRDQMARFDDADAANLDRFLEATRPIYDAIIADRLGSRPIDTVGSMMRLIPTILKLGAFVPVTTFVNRFFRNFRHRFIFSFHPLFVGGNPFRTPSIYLMIPYLEREGGVWFSRGGMYSVVEAMGTLFTELGGTIVTDAEAETIVVEDGRATGVRTAGRTYAADVVVSNADPGHYSTTSSRRRSSPTTSPCICTLPPGPTRPWRPPDARACTSWSRSPTSRRASTGPRSDHARPTGSYASSRTGGWRI